MSEQEEEEDAGARSFPFLLQKLHQLPPSSLPLSRFQERRLSCSSSNRGGEEAQAAIGKFASGGDDYLWPEFGHFLGFLFISFFQKKRFFVCVMDGRLQVIFEKKIYFFCCLFLAGLHPLPLVSANCFVGQGI